MMAKREREVEDAGRDSRLQGRSSTCDRRQGRKMGRKSLRLGPNIQKISSRLEGSPLDESCIRQK